MISSLQVQVKDPLANLEDWVNVVDENGRKGKRETNTMPQWAGSSWYFLRYIDPHNNELIADPEKLKAWLPVDLYVGGAEHAVLHLLYARFWHKFLYDLGVVPTKEPFQKLVNQGMILEITMKKCLNLRAMWSTQMTSLSNTELIHYVYTKCLWDHLMLRSLGRRWFEWG